MLEELPPIPQSRACPSGLTSYRPEEGPDQLSSPPAFHLGYTLLPGGPNLPRSLSHSAFLKALFYRAIRQGGTLCWAPWGSRHPCNAIQACCLSGIKL